MGNRIYLNNGWLFSEEFKPEMVETAYGTDDLQSVRIPHSCKETPFNYFDEHIYQMVSLYRKEIEVPMEWKGKQVFLTFEAVGHECEVYLNGEKIGEHHCGYTAFTLNLSEVLKFGETNELAVRVDSREDRNIPPFGHVIDYMTYGGIYRDVYLEVKDNTYLADVFLKSEIDWSQDGCAKLITEVEISGAEDGLSICQYYRIKAPNQEFKALGTTAFCKEFEFKMDDVRLWDVDAPILYEIKTELYQKDELKDVHIETFGFREAEFRKDGFYLNRKKLLIRGLNRHQSYPYVGYAMPQSMQEMDADVLKNDLGLNAVRTSHYPQSHYFLNRCDEIGLLVFTEIPGWQYIGNEEWKLQAIRNTEDMVRQYRNHCSIILWGVRINESPDDDEFYNRTNEAARRLDSSRQTGGVRCIKNSSLLEDVYTYNDFSHEGNKRGCEPKKNVTSDMEKPYLITEYNGHMFPTKSYDCEDHRVWHAMRHTNVINDVAKEADIAGSFGWCMADYNTHKDFGSGDRICYHGVLDMFRNPKLAAYVYGIQQENEPVLMLSSSMDIGEHPECIRGDIWIFTNADSVKMYKNDRFIKEYTNGDSPYKNLKHGPILVDDYIGDALEKNENFKPKQAKMIKELLNLTARYGMSKLPKKVIVPAIKLLTVYKMNFGQATRLYHKYIGDWGGKATVYRFDAIKDGKVVKTVIKEPMKQVVLAAEVSHTSLIESHSYDVAAIRIQAQDENGNLLPFFNEPVQIITDGAIELIGEPVISLKGGMGGAYVRTIGEAGKGKLKLKTAQAKEVVIEFEIKRNEAETL